MGSLVENDLINKHFAIITATQDGQLGCNECRDRGTIRVAAGRGGRDRRLEMEQRKDGHRRGMTGQVKARQE